KKLNPMFRYIVLLTAIFFCSSNRIKTSGSLNTDGLDIKEVLNSNGCTKNIKSAGYTEESVDKILDKIKNDNVSSADEIILILYSEEGEVINNFSVVLFFNDTVCKMILYINNKNVKSLVVEPFKANHLIDYLKENFQNDKPYPNQLLILNLEPKEVSCLFTRNLPPYLATEIKELSIIDKIRN